MFARMCSFFVQISLCLAIAWLGIVGFTQIAAADAAAAPAAEEMCVVEYTGDNQPDLATPDAAALRTAIALAGPGGQVKIAGTCAGVADQDGSMQVARVDKELTLSGGYTLTNWTTPDPARYPTRLDAQGAGRVIYSLGPATVTLQGLALQNGYSAQANGGGWYAAGPAMAHSVTFEHNQADAQGGLLEANGGGAYFEQAARLYGARFHDNHARYGGGAYFNHTAVLSQTHFSANHAVKGGGLVLTQAAQVMESTLADNQAGAGGTADPAGAGGGLWITGGEASIGQSGFYRNQVQGVGGSGGAIQIDGGQLILARTALVDNHSQIGGGVSAGELTQRVQIEYSLLAGNTAATGGQAVAHAGGTLTLIQGTIIGPPDTARPDADGSSTAGSSAIRPSSVRPGMTPAVSAAGPAVEVAGGSAIVYNTILSRQAVGLANTGAGSLTEDHNLFDQVPTPVSGPAVQGGHSFSAAAGFADTIRYTLAAGSPAIDAGLNSCLPLDYFGHPSPQGAAYDIGYAESSFGAAHWITPTVAGGGSISPSTPTQVAHGGQVTFYMEAGAGQDLSGVMVDGVSVGRVFSYTFHNVTADHTIHALFVPQADFLITGSAGPGGRISPSGGQFAGAGGQLTFTILPDPGYRIEDVQVNGQSVGPVSSYTFPNIHANGTIHATFAKNETRLHLPYIHGMYHEWPVPGKKSGLQE